MLESREPILRYARIVAAWRAVSAGAVADHRLDFRSDHGDVFSELVTSSWRGS